jgi:hypothetical protein
LSYFVELFTRGLELSTFKRFPDLRQALRPVAVPAFHNPRAEHGAQYRFLRRLGDGVKGQADVALIEFRNCPESSLVKVADAVGCAETQGDLAAAVPDGIACAAEPRDGPPDDAL